MSLGVYLRQSGVICYELIRHYPTNSVSDKQLAWWSLRGFSVNEFIRCMRVARVVDKSTYDMYEEFICKKTTSPYFVF
jgi:hypothetical protein